MSMLKNMKRYWCLEILGTPNEFSWRRLWQKQSLCLFVLVSGCLRASR